MLSTCRHPWWLHAVPNDGYDEGHMDVVWWFNVGCFHDFAAACKGVACSCVNAHRKSDSDRVMNRHLITDETKLGSVWYVHKCPRVESCVASRFRTTCGMIKQKQRASRIENQCRAWNAFEDARSVGDDMSARAWGMLDEMMLTACPRDEICDATMIAVSSGETYRTGTCRRHARLHCFLSKLRLISKKF